jgi:hypothetical protein
LKSDFNQIAVSEVLMLDLQDENGEVVLITPTKKIPLG